MSHSASDHPLVTVIMPVRNEALWIAQSVTAVLAQDYPAERLEIIVADGLSDDGTIATILRLPGAERVRIVSNPRRVQAAGLNCAIKLARGEIIVRVDGHTVIAPDYVGCCVALLHKTGADGVGGALNPIGQGTMGRAIAAASKSPFAVPSAFRFSTKAQDVDTVYMGAYCRRLFDRIGLYDEHLTINEDYELNYRIRKAGGRIYYSPELRSEYYGQQNLPAFARQYFRYGFWKPQTLRKHPGSLRARQLAAPSFVAFVTGGAFAASISHDFAAICALGILAYLLSNALFTLQVARRGWFASLCCVPLVFITVHAAWGSGFWVGVLHILLRRAGIVRANVS